MKTCLLVGAVLLTGTAAIAQTASPRPPSADAHVVLGWQNIHKPLPNDSYNDWLNAILYGGAGAGWYWTDHLKTQIDFGAGTSARQYRYRQFAIGGNPAFETSRVSSRQTSLAIGQQYQFFRNQWFHPHVGAGVELARETSTTEYDAVTVFDNVTHLTTVIRPAQTEGPIHNYIARGFGEIGFKAYMTPRAFFTGDLRLMFRHGIDEVLFRAGFGFDF